MSAPVPINLNNLLWKYALAICLFLFSHCKRDPPFYIPLPKTIGTFIGLVDGKTWRPQEYKANYYAKFNEVKIIAADPAGRMYLICGARLNPVNMMAETIFESNSYNSAEIEVDGRSYITDHNVMGGGGSLKILKLDTVSKRLSAELKITALNRLLNKSISFSTVKIENIELVMFNHDDPGSFVSVDIQGVNNTTWFSKTIPTGGSCTATGTYKVLTLDVFSGSGRRQLAFQIPLWKGVGEYQLKPHVRPYIYCTSDEFSTVYRYKDYGYGYLPAKGTFKITAVDTVARSLTATFNMTLVDSVTMQESIIMTNGQIKLVRY